MCSKIKVSSKVFEGLEAVRDSGKTNMFDIPAVVSIAVKMGHFETAVWAVDPVNKRKYAKGILYGFIPDTTEC